MELIKFEDFIKTHNEEIVATIGSFDGLHIAHQKLINTTIEIAKNKKLKSAIITFEPHPLSVLYPEKKNLRITSLDEKVKILKNSELDYLLVVTFTLDFASLEPNEFVEKFLLQANVKEVVVGFDFTFGKKGIGKANNITSLSNNKIETHIIDEIKIDNEKVGSTKIRSLLKQGLLTDVKELLGFNFKFAGKVIKGNHIGSTINVPTANLLIDEQLVELKIGVYAVKVYFKDQTYFGMMNVGHNPSFNFKDQLSFEVHILNFDHNVYDEFLEIECCKYLRPEIKFSSKEEFLNQIKKDKQAIRSYFNICEK